MKKQIELKPVEIDRKEMDALERALLDHFRKEIYYPLLDLIGLPKNTIKNAKDDLVSALGAGRVTYSRGAFRGVFSASLSKELNALGAIWDRKTSSWKISKDLLGPHIKSAIQLSESRFLEKLKKIDKQLAQISPADFAESLKIGKIFDTAIFKFDKNFRESVKNVTLEAKLSDVQREKIAGEWADNMKLWVRDFTEKEIKDLRLKMQENVFAGNRYESMIGKVQESYDTSLNKAKFLARQETNLLMAKYRETRFIDSGIKRYKWRTVAGSPNHPVRPMHKALDGRIFSWDEPPIVDVKGNRKHPGEDYNCRCIAIPIVD